MGDIKAEVSRLAKTEHWVWLSLKDKLGAALRAELLRRFRSMDALYYAERGELERLGILSEEKIRQLLDKDLDKSRRTLEKCDAENIRIVTLQDADYPEILRNIPDPPGILYYKGHSPARKDELAIAMVGTRRPSAYGMAAAERIARGIARGGGEIISGMARGLDSAAHRGALFERMPTTAVLGGGVDIVYPPENQQLYEDIIAEGTVLSEYAPGTKPEGQHFPERNRIISGLAQGVVVVEAGEHSGALITARRADEQGRDVFAVPGPIDSQLSEGTNMLIRDKYAKLVTCAEDVLVEYEFLFPVKLHREERRGERRQDRRGHGDASPAPERKKPPEKPAAKEPEKGAGEKKLNEKVLAGLSEDRRNILLRLADGPKYIDDIVDATGLKANVVIAELTMMTIEGFAAELAGGRYALGAALLE